MLAIMAVIVDYTFKMCSNFLYSADGAPKRRGAWVTYPHLLYILPGCINNALINALKKLSLRQF